MSEVLPIVHPLPKETSVNFQQFLAGLKYEVFMAVLPLAGAFATSVAANPTALNVVGQWAKLQASVIAAAPQLEQAVLQQLAQAINTEIQTVIAQAGTAAVPKTA